MKRLIIATTAAAAISLGGIAMLSPAHAATTNPVVSTTSRTVTLESPTCIHTHQVTTTYYHWSSKQHRYVAYDGPVITTLDKTVCHK